MNERKFNGILTPRGDHVKLLRTLTKKEEVDSTQNKATLENSKTLLQNLTCHLLDSSKGFWTVIN